MKGKFPTHLANPLRGLEEIDQLLQLKEEGLVAAQQGRLVLVEAQRVLLQLLCSLELVRVEDPVAGRHVLQDLQHAGGGQAVDAGLDGGRLLSVNQLHQFLCHMGRGEMETYLSTKK